jgi:hypothetical protein
MNKVIYYRQCSLKKATLTTTSWITEQFAVVGKVLRLKDDSGTCDDGWVVEAVFARRAESDLPDAHRDIKRLRCFDSVNDR